MNRSQVIAYIQEKYNCPAEALWADDPFTVVFRHRDTKRWFGIIQHVRPDRLGLPGDHELDLLNVKVEPELVAGLRGQPGIVPAYHMNKSHWISIILGGDQTCDPTGLLEMSWQLTNRPHNSHPKKSRKNASPPT